MANRNTRFPKSRTLITLTSMALLSAGPLAGLAPMAFGADRAGKTAYAIPAQSLREALLALSKQSGVQIIIATDAVSRYRSQPLQGSLTVAEALDRLLSGHNLEYVFTGDDTVTVREGTATPPPIPTPEPASAMPEQASAPSQGPQLSEVIVTAQKQEENMQTVPLAISALVSEDLEKKGVTSFEGVAKASPSITVTPTFTSSTTLTLYMRGQGSADPGAINSEGAVGFYEDGFYIARPNGAIFDMADVERVEVLRGPQGTLYGRNTTGGAVNLISKQPTGEFGFKQSLTFGTRNLFRSLTAINLPAVGGVATKLSLVKSSIDGYVKNTGSSHDFGEQAQQAGRFQLRWEATPDFTAEYFLEMGDVDSTPNYLQNSALNGRVIGGNTYFAKDAPMNRTYRPFDLKLSTSRFEGHGLTLSWDVTDDLTIKSLTGFRKLDANDYVDYADSFGFTSTMEDFYDDHHFSQEFQFIGNALDSRVNYVAGLYYFEESGSDLRTQTFGATQLTDLQAEATSMAAYGQVGWTPAVLDDRLEITLGGRFTEDERSLKRSVFLNGVVVEAPTDSDFDFSRFNPALTVNYQWSDEVTTYAKVATGYRSGGIYAGAGTGALNQAQFGPEELTTYEVGLKSYWLDRRLRANVALFNSEYKDMQLVINTAANLTRPGSSVVYNAGESTMRGAELELLALPFDDLTLGLNYAYLDATFDAIDVVPGTIFDNATNPASPYRVGDNLKRLFVLPYAPKHSVELSGDYAIGRVMGGDLDVHVDYRWQDSVYQLSNGGPDVIGREFNRLPSYGLLNARLSLAFDLPRGDRVKIGLWGRNLANKRYRQQTLARGGAAVPVQSPVTGVVAPAGFTSAAVVWSPPPSFGIDLQYEY